MRYASLFVLALISVTLLGQAVSETSSSVTVTTKDGATTTFEWSGDVDFEKRLIAYSAAGGATLKFSPGVFTFDVGIRVKRLFGLSFVGSPERSSDGGPSTIFRMREMREFGAIKIIEKADLEGGAFRVDHPELLRVGANYQIFRPDLKGNRVLEFELASVEGDKACVTGATNAGTKMFEVGMLVLPAISFFDGYGCGEIAFKDIDFDGNRDVQSTKIGDAVFMGHTMHCGIILRNRYADDAAGPAPRPATRGLRIEGCVFRGLLGRGAVAYNVADIVIAGCRFEDIGAECVEMDHLAQNAVVSDCTMKKMKIGMRLNDCTDVVVKNCSFAGAVNGIHVTRVMKNTELNKRLDLLGNSFDRVMRAVILDDNAGAMRIVDNTIVRSRIGMDLQGREILVKGNRLSEIDYIGLRIAGDGCTLEANEITGAAGVSEFTPIQRSRESKRDQ